MRLRYTRTARIGLTAQLDWLARLSPAAARRAADEIDHKLLLILEYPFAAPAVDGGSREAFIDFGRDGFLVRYRIEGDVLVVTRVFHGRQDRSR